MGGPVLLLAEALGVTLDDLTAVVDLAAAKEDFEVPMGPIGKGTVAGYRFELLGMVGGEAKKSPSSTSPGSIRTWRRAGRRSVPGASG